MNQKASRLGRVLQVASTIQDLVLSFLVALVFWLFLNPQQFRWLLVWLDKYRPPNWPGLDGMGELFTSFYWTADAIQFVQFFGAMAFAYLVISSIFNRNKKGGV